MAGLNTAQIIDRARAKGINLSNDQAQQILNQAWDQSQYGADSGKVDSLLGSFSGGTGNASSNPAEDFIKALSDQYQKQIDTITSKSKEFDAANPFSFDKILAQQSAEERYNPYYNAQLSDFLKGIQTQSSTLQGQQNLLTELNRVNAGQDAQKLQNAIDQTQNNYSDAGLFFSGARQRAVGNLNVGGNLQNTAREATYNQNLLQNQNAQTNLANQSATGQRNIGAERTTAIQTDIANQQAEEQARHATERAQYLFPYLNSSSYDLTGGINQLVNQAFQ